jgi:hypothetical protein
LGETSWLYLSGVNLIALLVPVLRKYYCPSVYGHVGVSTGVRTLVRRS